MTVQGANFAMSCCADQEQAEAQRRKQRRKRQLHRAVKDGEKSKEHLYREGQPKDKPLILEEDAAEHVVAVIKDDMKEDDFAGKTGTAKTIVKGKCLHCGSNRLISGHKEPAGVGYLECPVCHNENISSDNPAKLEVHNE